MLLTLLSFFSHGRVTPAGVWFERVPLRADRSEVLALTISAVAGILVVGLLFVVLQRKRQRAEVRIFRCPSCTQQIRYTPAQAGVRGPCPRCWNPVTLPVHIADAADRTPHGTSAP